MCGLWISSRNILPKLESRRFLPCLLPENPFAASTSRHASSWLRSLTRHFFSLSAEKSLSVGAIFFKVSQRFHRETAITLSTYHTQAHQAHFAYLIPRSVPRSCKVASFDLSLTLAPSHSIRTGLARSTHRSKQQEDYYYSTLSCLLRF